MTFPVNIPIGSLLIPVHFVCEVLAYTAGYNYYSYLRYHNHDRISTQHRMIIFTGAAIGAFLGSHLLGILEKPGLIRQVNLIYFMGNTTIVGGLLGGLTGVEFTKSRIGVNASSGDMMVYPLMLAMMIGRMGCFLAGLPDGTYGNPSSLPWAIDLGDGLARHPTNLYEILFWICLWLSLSLLQKRRSLPDGYLFRYMMVAYLIFRFFIEFIKPAEIMMMQLSTIQLACLGGLIYYFTKPGKPVQNTENYA